MQLTEAEASFRALKSELSIRPLFHQKEPRVKAHVVVAFLGYALWVTLKHLLKRRLPWFPQHRSAAWTTRSRYRPCGRWFYCPRCRAPTSSCPRRMGARSASAGSPNQRWSRNPCFTNLAFACRNG